MEKHYIKVPHDDMELAKQLGAKWDGERKEWYYYDNSQLSRIAKWLLAKGKTKEKLVYLRYTTGEEILKHLGIRKDSLYRLDCRDQDMKNSVMVKGLNEEGFSSFFTDIYRKSDLSSEEIRILEAWLRDNIPMIY